MGVVVDESVMSIVFTRPMKAVISDAFRRKINRTLDEFPELAGKKLIIGLTRSARLDGQAEIENFLVRFNITKRRHVSYYTIGHELTHLLQTNGLGLVPSGEVQCDVWTLARSQLFLDERPSYLPLARKLDQRQWRRHGAEIRKLCLESIEVRKQNRLYLVWLHEAIQRYLSSAPSRSSRGSS